jgi:hypothetical protein
MIPNSTITRTRVRSTALNNQRSSSQPRSRLFKALKQDVFRCLAGGMTPRCTKAGISARILVKALKRYAITVKKAVPIGSKCHSTVVADTPVTSLMLRLCSHCSVEPDSHTAVEKITSLQSSVDISLLDIHANATQDPRSGEFDRLPRFCRSPSI